MEPQKEPQLKPTPHARSTVRPTAQDRPLTTAKFERVSYAREACYGMGAIFITIGLLGFVTDNLLGAHLSYAHNIIHVLSGLAAVICAYSGRSLAQKFAIAFGVLYGALGVLGFALGVPTESTTGHIARDSSLWILSPGVLEFGTSDHVLHLIFAAIFIAAAMVRFQRRTDAGAIYH